MRAKLNCPRELTLEDGAAQLVGILSFGSNDDVVDVGQRFSRIAAQNAAAPLDELAGVLRRGQDQSVRDCGNIHAFI